MQAREGSVPIQESPQSLVLLPPLRFSRVHGFTAPHQITVPTVSNALTRAIVARHPHLYQMGLGWESEERIPILSQNKKTRETDFIRFSFTKKLIGLLGEEADMTPPPVS